MDKPYLIGVDGGTESLRAGVFGREVYDGLGRDIPIGLIDNSVGGTEIEAWTTAPDLVSCTDDLLSNPCAARPACRHPPWLECSFQPRKNDHACDDHLPGRIITATFRTITWLAFEAFSPNVLGGAVSAGRIFARTAQPTCRWAGTQPTHSREISRATSSSTR